MSPRLNRRELLVAGGAVGAAVAAVSAVGNPAEAGVELGRYARRAGVQGKMTGAQAAAAALACQGVRCVFGIPGAQTNELWDAFKARARSLSAGRQRGFGQRHGRRVGPRDGRGRCLLGGARSGIDQRTDRDRRGPAG